MRVHGAGHGDGADFVADAVVGFVLDRRAGVLLAHAGLESATLDHEVVDHPVEDGVVVVAVTHILLEVLDCLRCLVGEEFQGNDPVVGMQLDHAVDPRLG